MDVFGLEYLRMNRERIQSDIARYGLFFLKKCRDHFGDRLGNPDICRSEIEGSRRRCWRGVRAIHDTTYSCRACFRRSIFAFCFVATLHHPGIHVSGMQRHPRQHPAGESKKQKQRCQPPFHPNSLYLRIQTHVKKYILFILFTPS